MRSWSDRRTYIEAVLLDFVVVTVVARCASTPEAVLTEVVVITALALVPKAGE